MFDTFTSMYGSVDVRTDPSELFEEDYTDVQSIILPNVPTSNRNNSGVNVKSENEQKSQGPVKGDAESMWSKVLSFFLKTKMLNYQFNSQHLFTFMSISNHFANVWLSLNQ